MLCSVLLWFPIDLILTLLILPFCLIIFCPVLLYRQFVKFYAKCIHPTYILAPSYDQAVSHDIFVARSKETDPSFISGTMLHVFGNIELSNIRQRWKRVLLEARNQNGEFVYPRLSYATVLFGGYLFFKPIVVDLETSIHEMELGDGETLNEFKSRFLHRPLPPSSPMWELVILKMREDSYLLTRFHHSIVDGYSQLHAIKVFLGETQDFEDFPQNNVKFGYNDMFLTGIQTVRLIILQNIKNLKAKFSISVECSRPRPDRALMADTIIDYADLKYIVRKTKTTFTALNFTVYAGVLQRLLNKTQAQDATVAILTASPWPNHPIKNGQFANHFSTICPVVPIGEKNSLKRLLETDNTIRKTYEIGMDRLGRWVLMKWMAALPLMWVGKLQCFAETFGGIKCMNVTMVSLKSGFRTLDGLPIISVSSLVGRCSINVAFGEAMVIENGKCLITFVASTNVVHTQAKIKEIMPFFQEEVKALVDEIKRQEVDRRGP